MRSKDNQYTSEASQFVDFIKRMGRNDSSRTAVRPNEALNSTFKGFRSATRRSDTEGNQTNSTSALPIRIEESMGSEFDAEKESAKSRF
jgi:hypothetical protein